MPLYLVPMANAFIRLSGTTQTPDASIGTFTEWATSMLAWFITTMETVLSFFLSHPIVLVGLVMSLIVAAIGMLRHIIGGKSKEDVSPKEA